MFNFLKKLFSVKRNEGRDVLKVENEERVTEAIIEDVQQTPSESIEKAEIVLIENEEIKPQDKSHFYDEDQFIFEDYSSLSPREARKEMNERKEDGEYLSWEEYGGYMNAIHEDKDLQYMDKIAGMTTQQTEKWFLSRKENRDWITPAIWEFVAEKLKPYHEEYLINEMDKVTPGRIESWVKKQKEKGYFFSDEAYEKADKIFYGLIDNRKRASIKKTE